jgi:hypothetical protein
MQGELDGDWQAYASGEKLDGFTLQGFVIGFI